MRITPALLASIAFHTALIASGVFYSSRGGATLNLHDVKPITVEFISDSPKEPETPPLKENQDHITEKQIAKLPKKVKPILAQSKEAVTPEPENHNKKNSLDLTPLGGNAIPEYPDQAKQEGIEGRFTLVLEVDRNGHVKSIKDTDSSQTTNFTLVESAKKTALQWKFKRTRGTTEYVNVPFTFVLDL